MAVDTANADEALAPRACHRRNQVELAAATDRNDAAPPLQSLSGFHVVVLGRSGGQRAWGQGEKVAAVTRLTTGFDHPVAVS